MVEAWKTSKDEGNKYGGRAQGGSQGKGQLQHFSSDTQTGVNVSSSMVCWMLTGASACYGSADAACIRRAPS